jgi:hypothetical protein
MFSNLIKLTFVISAYAPIILIWWLVSVYNLYQSGEKLAFINLAKIELSDLFNRLNLIFLFIFVVIICWYIISSANRKLTRNKIEVKSIKSSDLNMNSLIISYFLPCVEIFKKDAVYLIIWIFILFIIALINKGTYYYNPLFKIFGYNYYEIVTKKDVTYLMISKYKLKNTIEINAYSQITNFVLLNTSNN